MENNVYLAAITHPFSSILRQITRSDYRSDMARPKLIDYRLIFTLNSYIFSKKPRIDYLECIFVISIKFYVDIDSQNIG